MRRGNERREEVATEKDEKIDLMIWNEWKRDKRRVDEGKGHRNRIPNTKERSLIATSS